MWSHEDPEKISLFLRHDLLFIICLLFMCVTKLAPQCQKALTSSHLSFPATSSRRSWTTLRSREHLRCIELPVLYIGSLAVGRRHKAAGRPRKEDQVRLTRPPNSLSLIGAAQEPEAEVRVPPRGKLCPDLKR